MSTVETIHHRMVRARLVKSLRQYPVRIIDHAELATAVGVTASVVSLWESGKRRPNRDRVPKVAEFYEVNPYWLESGVGPMLTTELRVEGDPTLATFVAVEPVQTIPGKRGRVIVAQTTKANAKHPKPRRSA